jgi:hypothetical protein
MTLACSSAGGLCSSWTPLCSGYTNLFSSEHTMRSKGQALLAMQWERRAGERYCCRAQSAAKRMYQTISHRCCVRCTMPPRWQLQLSLQQCCHLCLKQSSLIDLPAEFFGYYLEDTPAPALSCTYSSGVENTIASDGMWCSLTGAVMADSDLTDSACRRQAVRSDGGPEEQLNRRSTRSRRSLSIRPTQPQQAWLCSHSWLRASHTKRGPSGSSASS